MKKKIQIIVLVILAVAGFAGSTIAGIMSQVQNRANVTMDIAVENGQATPNTFSSWIDVEKDGTYEMQAKWWPEQKPGFVTGLVVKDESGSSVYAVTAGMIEVSGVTLKLSAGRYDLEYVIFENLEEINGFIEDYMSEDDILYDFYGCRDGQYSIDYSFELYRAGANYLLITVLFGVVAFVSLCGIIFLFVQRKKTEKKYDERQDIIRGIGYKYGFFAMLIYNTMAYIIYLCNVNLPVSADVLFIFGILLGAIVVATYCIWKDAYYALNENRKQVNTLLGVIGALNIGIGIMNCFQGNAIENGKLGTGAINLVCGVLFIYIFIIIMVKSIVDKRSE